MKMSLVKKIALVMAVVLVVGACAGLIVRKQTGGQTVMQHSGGGSAASTTPATDDLPAEEKKIPIVVFGYSGESVLPEDYTYPFSIVENGSSVSPFIDDFLSGYFLNGSHDYDHSCVFFVDPASTSIVVESAKKGDTRDISGLAVSCLFSDGTSDRRVGLMYGDSFDIPEDSVFVCINAH